MAADLGGLHKHALSPQPPQFHVTALPAFSELFVGEKNGFASSRVTHLGIPFLSGG